MSEEDFEVEDPGSPNLHPDDAPPPPVDGDQVPDLPPPGWGDEQAGDFVAALAYTGLLVFFISRHGRLPNPQEFAALAVNRQEVAQTAHAAKPLLDRFLPVDGVGGVAAAGVAMIAIPAELGMVVMRRMDYRVVGPDGHTIGTAPLLRKPPAPRDVTRESAPGAQATPAPADGNGAAPSPAAPASSSPGDFHLDPKAAAVAEAHNNGDTFPGVGI